MLDRRGFLTLLGTAGAVLTVTPACAEVGLPQVVVSKDPSCLCCAGWVEHLKAASFPVEVRETLEINRVKIQLGVPQDLASCHTAAVGGYVIEGHVPADAIKRLLTAKPQATGLAVPGMPAGSPGMETPGGENDTYDVVLFGPSGRTIFARYNGSRVL
ncbi:DUF411 domain-containing protein [Microvirga rosea]|uniref:DUF411 domain-containing protein n=1 Tax=Microvirga rosea TaxID=2715425 RepID=UPI001D0AC742|nr:DUF411 domain-containing protein [Microvirga rosea]MCB8822501.1 DUF411 domain-containing protein [Microvirga rosea]